MAEKIYVGIRIRPLNAKENSKGTPWKVEENNISLCNSKGMPINDQIYTFDHVSVGNISTEEIYGYQTKEIIESTVHGFNGTVFAYGQTSSGKTYTMRGSESNPGIISLSIADIFRNINQIKDREFLIRVSYMEIYNEEINDLLAPENKKLQIHENSERGIYVAGLREEIINSPNQVHELLNFGESHRKIGETNMNIYSSRSHTIFRMVIESRDRNENFENNEIDCIRVSALNLVDLAGSERISKTGAEGRRLKEGVHINKSLMTLGNVINKLCEGKEKNGGHVPYRDSKLTRILQPALGGNSKTIIICCITPALIHADETRVTLQFASRALKVTNCAQINEVMSDAALLKRQMKEIDELRQKLKSAHSPELEQDIFNLRCKLLKIESEKERMTVELEEEKLSLIQHQIRIKEQERKINNLSKMVINFPIDNREEKKGKKDRRETWCPRVNSETSSPMAPLRMMNRNIEEKVVNIFPITKRRNRLKNKNNLSSIYDESNENIEENFEENNNMYLKDDENNMIKTNHVNYNDNNDNDNDNNNDDGNNYNNSSSDNDDNDGFIDFIDNEKENDKVDFNILNIPKDEEDDVDAEEDKLKISPLKRSRFTIECDEMDHVKSNQDHYEMFNQQILELKAKNEILEEEFTQRIILKENEIEELEEKIANFQLKEFEIIENMNENIENNEKNNEKKENENSNKKNHSLNEYCINDENLYDKYKEMEGENKKLFKKIEYLSNELLEYKQKNEKNKIENKNMNESECENESLKKEILILKENFKEKEKNCSKLTMDLLDLREEKANYEVKIERINKEVNEYKENLSEALFKMECLKQQNIMESNQMRTEFTSLRKELNNSKLIPLALEKEKENLMKEMERMKSKYKEMENKFKCVLIEKNVFMGEKTNLEKEIKILHNQSHLLAKDFNKKDLNKEKKENSLNKTKLQLSNVECDLKNKTQLLDQYLNELKNLQTSNDSLEVRNSEFIQKIDSLNEKVKRMEDELASTCAEKDKIEKESEDWKESNSKLNFQILEIESQLQKSRQENSKLSLKLMSTEDELIKEKNNFTKINELENEISKFSNQLLESNILIEKEKSIYENKQKELNNIINNLEKNCFYLEKENEKLEKVLKDMNDDLKKINIKNKSLMNEFRMEIQEMEVEKMKKIEEKLIHISTLEEKVLNLNSELSNNQQIIEEKNEKMNEYEMKIKENEEKMEKFSSLFFKSMKKLGKSKEEIDDYSKKVELLEKSNSKNSKEFNLKFEIQNAKILTLQSENEENKTNFQSEKDKLDDVILRLSSDMEEDKRAIEELTRQIADLERKNSELEIKHAELESTVDELENKNIELTSKHAELESAHAELESEHAELESVHAELESQRVEMECKVMEHAKMCHEYIQKIRSLEKDKIAEKDKNDARVKEEKSKWMEMEKRCMTVMMERDELRKEKEERMREEGKNSMSAYLDQLEIEKEVISLTKSLNLLTRQLENTEANLESERLKLEIISKIKDEKESHLEKNNEKILKLQDMNRCLRKENKELKTKLSGLEFQHTELKDWVGTVPGNLEIFEKHAELKDAHHRSICLSIEIDELNLKIRNLEKENKSLRLQEKEKEKAKTYMRMSSSTSTSTSSIGEDI